MPKFVMIETLEQAEKFMAWSAIAPIVVVGLMICIAVYACRPEG